MVSVPLGKSDWRRGVADEADIPVVNRYFEQNPTNLEDQVSLISRPGLKRFVDVGQGPVRALYSQPGSFDDALFIVAHDTLWRLDTDMSSTSVGSGIFGESLKASPSMAATAKLGSVPEYLYLADGRILWVYTDNAAARGTLGASGTIADTYKIEIGGVYYQWTSGSVDTGTPAGTTGSPWLVLLGGDNSESFDNMRLAINNSGTPGTTYSTALEEHPSVQAISSSSLTLIVNARDNGAPGNSITTTVSSGANIAWSAATLEDGGDPLITQVQVPDDAGVVSVGYIAGYIIVVIAQGYGVNGRFYWINPGDTFIDALNFATAERSPDPLFAVRVVGDQFWLMGTSTTEVWYPSGDALAPFQRVQGQLFDRGIWGGTDAFIKGSVMIVDNDGVVYQITGGSPQRVSNNGIEERIREAMRIASLELS